jgi:phthiocerol/phenolphthiocerol synthesis type-I polyketide synthase E
VPRSEFQFARHNLLAESVTDPSTVQVAVAEDATTRQLARIWQELLGIESVGPDQNYFDLGGDSPLAVHLFSRIEKEFKVKLPLATLFEAPTIEELAQVVRRKAATSGWSPLVAIQPAGSRPNFFCIHGAGGNVLIYRELSKHLGTDQPFHGLQSQGLDGKQPLLTRVEEMAALYANEIQGVQPHGPYFLGGYCMGGTVAFEVAQQLIARGERVAMLALFDTIDWSKVDVDAKWVRFSYQIQRVWFHLRNFLLLNWSDQTKFFAEKWKVLKSRTVVWRGSLLGSMMKDGQSNQSESWLLAQIWNNNDRSASHYVPRALDCFIVDIRPLKQYSVFDRPDVHWDQLALKGVEVIDLPVYPAGMLIEPFVKHLAEALEKSIGEAHRTNSSN